MAGRRCSICDHKRRSEIDAAVAKGDSCRAIAGRFRVSRSAFDRHVRNHLTKHRELAEATRQNRDLTAGVGIDAELLDLKRRTLAVLEHAERAKKTPTWKRVALAAIREARENVTLDARLTGRLKSGPTIEIHTHPEWLELRLLLIEALRPFPEAAAAVASALVRYEGRKGLPEKAAVDVEARREGGA